MVFTFINHWKKLRENDKIQISVSVKFWILSRIGGDIPNFALGPQKLKYLLYDFYGESLPTPAPESQKGESEGRKAYWLFLRAVEGEAAPYLPGRVSGF